MKQRRRKGRIVLNSAQLSGVAISGGGRLSFLRVLSGCYAVSGDLIDCDENPAQLGSLRRNRWTGSFSVPDFEFRGHRFQLLYRLSGIREQNMSKVLFVRSVRLRAIGFRLSGRC